MNPRPAPAAQRIRDAVRTLLDGAGLDDVAAFITASRLAREAGVSPSTLQALHPPEAAADGSVRTSAQAAVRRALFDPVEGHLAVQDSVEALMREAVEVAHAEGDRPGIAEVVGSLADLAVECADGTLAGSYTEGFLLGAVANGDDELRAASDRQLALLEASYADLARTMCELTGREPVEGVSHRDLAVAAMLAFDGAVLNLRLHPEVGREAAGRLFLAVWTALTRRLGDVDDLLERRAADPSGSPLSETELAAVAAAVHRLHDRVGWGGVTLRKVGQLSGLPPGRLAAVVPDRDHLAGIAWADVCRDVTEACPTGTLVDRVARVLVDAACSHRGLVQSVLRAGLGAGGAPAWWTVPGRGEGPWIEALTGSVDGPSGEVAAVVVDAVLLGAAHDARAPVLEQVVRALLAGAQ